ncbi:MAG: hypothetical protein COZ75_09345 [Flavobacteriaceae bacterium CG_4_8_14_3_um_filter_34_10]|nr:hypothetical protein [Flavobacteriia bacterium]OIP51611.1 MAG: hypothetical protein AUK33_03880 [Flavobacteriaceae bacterium CG2_30_34_30]PIQ18800.1 MAG: hypothetical protein COW66_04480 [Flavobacteriaceae bacterium CG18_big_fil_WC_8_21_14_2_50_34_36]PIV49919.1 MAG: hypothetical protein COS19_06135 [Flavobacteriaceae bacterium CG02_land_8_20_14_3_00_34_13]PIX08958.1 MAG: hypothetical protein COZ75_09345 [Flavobacteriaceae bacterium CG_4_8_14_3_um_filter_34_10]PIZ07620.1 MAG: hypothetical pr
MQFLYFDPGLGAMVAQAAVAIVAAVVLFSKTAMFKIKSMLGLYKDNPDFYDNIDEVEDKDKDNENDQPQSNS